MHQASSHEAGTFEIVMGLAARVRHRGDEFQMSKVVQLRAAIAPRGFALPQHLNLMSSDAGNRAESGGLAIVIAHRSMFGYRPRTPGTLTTLNLAPSSVFSQLLASPRRLLLYLLCI